MACAASGTSSTRASRGLTSLLPEELQARAFDHRGGPSAARRATLWTAGAARSRRSMCSVFCRDPGRPLGPVLGVLAGLLLADAAQHVRATRRGRYAPSLFRFVLATDLLRPERVAYHAHRDTERRILDSGVRSSG